MKNKPKDLRSRSQLLIPIVCALVLPVLFPGCGGQDAAKRAAAVFLTDRQAPKYGYRIVQKYSHDPANFTEGLDIDGSTMFESTGLQGSSRLIKESFPPGEVLASVELDGAYFGEGATVLGGEVFQLTYRSGLCFVYDQETLALKRTLRYQTEGWGLSDDGQSLVMSDGSNRLYFLDRQSGQVLRTMTVGDESGPVNSLNELEYADGEIYANIWKQDVVVMISPETGEVDGWIDLSGLKPAGLPQGSVLNGIASDPASGNLVVTGKYWPSMFEIELVPQ